LSLKGGEKLKSYIKGISNQGNQQLKFGILEGATNSEGMSLATIMFWNEYGTKNIPPRPAVRTTVDSEKANWSNSLVTMMKAQHPNYDFEGAMEVIGDIASKDIQEAIQTWSDPPNAPGTIASKKKKGYSPYDQPLVETGDMLRAVSYEVVKK